jgi:hypothetical protein
MDFNVRVAGFDNINVIRYRSITRAIGVVLIICSFFSFGTTAPIWALAYLSETLRFTSVY